LSGDVVLGEAAAEEVSAAGELDGEDDGEDDGDVEV
jgi:hypothetical protein